MNWGQTPINLLSDADLWAAIQTVADIDNFRFDKLKDPRINKQGHRLQKIFSANPPTESQAFIDLATALNNEWQNRNKKK